MLTFNKYLLLKEEDPLGSPVMPPAGAGAPPMGGPAGAPPPMGGIGGAPPMGGDPMGGMGGGMGAPVAPMPMEIEPLSVWKVLEKLLDGKHVKDKKPESQPGQSQDDMLQQAQPQQPSPTDQQSSSPGMAPSGSPAAGSQPQHLLGTPGI